MTRRSATPFPAPVYEYIKERHKELASKRARRPAPGVPAIPYLTAGFVCGDYVCFMPALDAQYCCGSLLSIACGSQSNATVVCRLGSANTQAPASPTKPGPAGCALMITPVSCVCHRAAWPGQRNHNADPVITHFLPALSVIKRAAPRRRWQAVQWAVSPLCRPRPRPRRRTDHRAG